MLKPFCFEIKSKETKYSGGSSKGVRFYESRKKALADLRKLVKTEYLIEDKAELVSLCQMTNKEFENYKNK
jgi:hypothetical protein